MWKFEKQSDGTYKIINEEYKKLLDGGRVYMSALDEKSEEDILDQRWYIYDRDGYCILRAASRNAVADVSDDTYVMNKSYNAEYNQQFKVNAVNPDVYLLGDIDNDGVISVMDATNVQLSVANIVVRTEDEFKRADVDADKNITVMDATHIQRHLAQYDAELGIGEPV